MLQPHRLVDDVPRYLVAADYDTAKSKLEEICRNAGVGCSSIGYFGEVSDPGISDIDAIIVGDANQLRLVSERFVEKRNADQKFADTFWHEPVYLLKGTEEDSKLLHTLENLNWLVKSEAVGFSDHGIDSNSRFVLNLAWLAFLIRVILVIERMQSASLRTLLLVQKNLEYSERYFRAQTNSTSSFEPRTQQLRTSVLEKVVNARERVSEEFSNRFKSTLTCIEGISDSDANSVAADSKWNRTLLLDRKTIIVRGLSDDIPRSKRTYFRRVRVPTFAFDLGTSFIRGKSEQPGFQRYIEATFRVAEAYTANGLNYPFITPFRIPVSKHRRQILKFIGNVLNVTT